jgi:hypothetical protein
VGVEWFVEMKSDTQRQRRFINVCCKSQYRYHRCIFGINTFRRTDGFRPKEVPDVPVRLTRMLNVGVRFPFAMQLSRHELQTVHSISSKHVLLLLLLVYGNWVDKPHLYTLRYVWKGNLVTSAGCSVKLIEFSILSCPF